jgi:dTDP-4-amino-4,6-dideoxygalactose transaminase
MKKIEDFIERREKISRKYSRIFNNNPYFDLPGEKRYAKSSWHLYPIRLKDMYIKFKKHIFDTLCKKRIRAQVHYIPVYLHPYYESLGYRKGDCINAEKFYEKEISIPIYQSMSSKDSDYVVDTIQKIFKDLNRKYKI